MSLVRCGRQIPVQEASFAETLRRQRLSAGLTQEELAERARLSVRAISDLERGKKRAPRPSTVRLLVEGLGLSAIEAAALTDAARGPGSDERPDAGNNLPLRFRASSAAAPRWPTCSDCSNGPGC